MLLPLLRLQQTLRIRHVIPRRGLTCTPRYQAAAATALKPRVDPSSVQAQAQSQEPSDDSGLLPLSRIRNIAIIAHVDHGKTTLVDQLLRQSGTLRQLSATEQTMFNPSSLSSSPSPSPSSSSSTTTTSDAAIENGFITRIMDSNTLERERGITILSKCTSIAYEGHLINIVDTPGHADFGGEVERVLSMVDGVVLVVDAAEGPMAQTRFVLSKALSRGLKPLVVLNKADRDTARPLQVESDLFDLFATLGATDEQADYPVLYASAKQGWAVSEIDAIPTASSSSSSTTDIPRMTPLFSTILTHTPPPTHLSRSKPFKMLTTQISSDPYVGTCYLGRIHSGVVRVGDAVVGVDEEGRKVGSGTIRKIFSRLGVERVDLPAAGAGDIVSLAGIKGDGMGVNITLVAEGATGDDITPLEVTSIDPPTISILLSPNDSPLAGLSGGTKLTSQLIRDRITLEATTNVALSVLPGPTSEVLELRGRGVLHLGVLLETLRREGFEFCVGPPKAILLPDPEKAGGWLEPIEEVGVLVREEYAGTVVQKLTIRKGEMVSYESEEEGGMVKIVMHVPARGLIGYMAGEFGNDVHGQGTINHIFKAYEPYRGPIDTGRNGALISMASGESSAYAMAPLQARGTLFIQPQTKVYPGMVIGESSKSSDLYINPCAKKQLTNIRAAGADEKIVLSSPRVMGLEEAMAYMADDEVVEVTPECVRLRKKELDVGRRMRAGGGGKGGKK